MKKASASCRVPAGCKAELDGGGPITLWHVMGRRYKQGDDILSWGQQEAEGRLPKRGKSKHWKWPDVDTGYDSHLVCSYTDRREAERHAEEYGGRLLQIDVPPNAVDAGMRPVINDEGFLCFHNPRVPGEWVTPLPFGKQRYRRHSKTARKWEKRAELLRRNLQREY